MVSTLVRLHLQIGKIIHFICIIHFIHVIHQRHTLYTFNLRATECLEPYSAFSKHYASAQTARLSSVNWIS